MQDVLSYVSIFITILMLWLRVEHRLTKIETKLIYIEKRNDCTRNNEYNTTKT